MVKDKKEQIYGTQGSTFNVKKNGKVEMVSLIWPIKNFGEVNALRKQVGFTETVEEYSKNLFGNDFVLKNYTLEEALQLQNKNKN